MKSRVVDIYRTYDSNGNPFHTYYRYEVYDSEKKYWKRELPCIEIGEILIGEDLKGNNWWLNSRSIEMESLMNSLFGDTYMSYQTSSELLRDLNKLFEKKSKK